MLPFYCHICPPPPAPPRKGVPCPLTLPHPKPLGNINPFSISIILSFQECYANGVMKYVTLALVFFAWHNPLEFHSG